MNQETNAARAVAMFAVRPSTPGGSGGGSAGSGLESDGVPHVLADKPAITRSVYVVEDDAAVRGALYGLLSARQGFSVRLFHSGDDFLAGKDALGPGVVLLDYDMPGASGMDVLLAIAGDQRFVTIFLTGWSDVSLAVQAMKAGALDFLPKPHDSDALFALVETAAQELVARHTGSAGAQAARAKLQRLSPRERDVLDGLIAGDRNKVIAHRLGISIRTVEIYRGNLMDKLGAASLADVLRIAFEAGVGLDR